jgi:hypothetical protein
MKLFLEREREREGGREKDFLLYLYLVVSQNEILNFRANSKGIRQIYGCLNKVGSVGTYYVPEIFTMCNSYLFFLFQVSNTSILLPFESGIQGPSHF